LLADEARKPMGLTRSPGADYATTTQRFAVLDRGVNEWSAARMRLDYDTHLCARHLSAARPRSSRPGPLAPPTSLEPSILAASRRAYSLRRTSR
jgi:hypothetical protein